MDATIPSSKYRRWLPFWAVFWTDLRQTLHSWVYRLWLLISVLTALGYLLYRVGVYREAGIVQSASVLTSDLLGGMVLGSLALIVVLAVGAISAERGSVADSILSRGISRFQYFLAKLNARLVAVLMTYLGLSATVLLSSHFLLEDEVSWNGCVAGLATVAALLAVIVTWGVAVGAMSNGTVIGITTLWVILYGGGFLLTLVPAPYPSPERLLEQLPRTIRGHYDTTSLTYLLVGAGSLSIVAVIGGMIGFARKDV